MKEIASLLKDEIEKGLPGSDIQWQMASSDRMINNFPRSPGSDAKVAAVMILLYPDKRSVSTVLMQRTDYIGVHGGQISFPGGKKEWTDHDVIQTALRELNEETGVDRRKIRIIGTLTPLYIHVSKIVVTPVIGWINKKPHFIPQRDEVEFLFDAELTRLMDPSIVKTRPLKIKEEMINVKYFDYDGNVIWGATAMILNELLCIIKRSGFSLT